MSFLSRHPSGACTCADRWLGSSLIRVFFCSGSLPAQGQAGFLLPQEQAWIPACAGMTKRSGDKLVPCNCLRRHKLRRDKLKHVVQLAVGKMIDNCFHLHPEIQFFLCNIFSHSAEDFIVPVVQDRDEIG